MSIIDLQSARERRVALRQMAEAHMRDLAESLMKGALDAADHAFSVSGPLAGQDEAMARAVNQFSVRRLRNGSRKRLGRDVDPELVRYVLDKATELHLGRLMALIEERDSQRGRA